MHGNGALHALLAKHALQPQRTPPALTSYPPMAKQQMANRPAEAREMKPAAEKPGPKRSSRNAQVTTADTIMATMARRDCSTARVLSMVYCRESRREGRHAGCST